MKNFNHVITTIKLNLVLLVLPLLMALPLKAQWTPSSLSNARFNLSATSSGSKAFFAGGFNHRKVFKLIDVYDNDTNTWTKDSLSEARYNLVSTSLGSKVFFAGGDNGTDYLSTIDIYDNITHKWSRARLTQPRCELAATSVGTKVFFAGGRKGGRPAMSDVIDIYDTKTNTWSIAHLSEARGKLNAASVGTKVFFAGGLNSTDTFSDAIDIYDISSNTWTTHKLSQERDDLAVTTVGSKVLFAGGENGFGESDVVDIYDNVTNTWTTHHLSLPRFDLAGITVGNLAIFAGGHTNSHTTNVVDIYDNSTNTWTTATLSQARNSIAAASVGTKAIFAGGWGNISTRASNLVETYDIGKIKDTQSPEIQLIYKSQGTTNGRVEVEILVVDASLVSIVAVNNEERINLSPDDSISFLAEFAIGEEVTITATDNFNQRRDKNFIIKAPVSSPVPTVRQKNKYYALLIAVEEYKDKGIISLNEPVNDATLLKNVLTKNYTFDEADVIFLKNPTFENITEVFEGLRKKITADDLLLIFYAGHGDFDKEANIGYWLPTDASLKNKAKWYRNSVLVEDIGAIKSKHTLLISDACFSGGIFKTRAANNNASAEISNMMSHPSRKAMTSGSMTTVPDKSVFVKYLIKKLEENQNRFFPSEDLFDEIRLAMKSNADTRPEYGVIRNTGDEGGNFVFIQQK